jgi:hypothetical protein
MGGLVGGATVKGDLWLTEMGNGSLACYPISTTGDGPGPRVGHASLLVGNAFIVFGGDTKLADNDDLDDTLYLLNTCKSPACGHEKPLTHESQPQSTGRAHCHKALVPRDVTDTP